MGIRMIFCKMLEKFHEQAPITLKICLSYFSRKLFTFLCKFVHIKDFQNVHHIFILFYEGFSGGSKKFHLLQLTCVLNYKSI